MYEEYFRNHTFPLRRTRPTNSSIEDEDLYEYNKYKPIFVPVLSHQFHVSNLEIVKSYFSTKGNNRDNAFSGQPKKYGGIIFTSQRAVEAFGHILAHGDIPGLCSCCRFNGLFNKTDGLIIVEIATSTSQDLVLYSVGPATTRTLTPIRDKYLPFATIYGDQAGNGEILAHFILEHYNERYHLPAGAHKPALLFLVGEQRRDIIPKTLMNEELLDEGQRITVDELVVYETSEMKVFEAAFREAVEAGEKSLLEQEATQQQIMWAVIFSPTGCDAVLRTLDIISPLQDRDQTNPINPGGKRKNCLIATIGPTTRDYLLKNYGFEPDVVARKPSPEGVGEAIREYLVNKEEE